MMKKTTQPDVFEAVEDLNAGASYEEIQDEVEDLPLEQFCQQLDFLVKSDDSKAKALYDTFRKGWKQEFKNIKVTQAFVNIRELHPTQNVIFAHKSLDLILNGKWRMPGATFAVDVLLGDEKPQVEMGDPIVVCNVGGVDYLIDGHHRWSKAYAFNPSCSMKAYIINEAFANADEVLKFAQGTLTILKNKSPINNAQPSNDINLYDITPQQLSGLVNASLNREVLEHIRNLPVTKGIVNDPSTLVSYLWSNVRILRQYAPKGAHDREFMPQFPDGDTNPASAVAKIKESTKFTLTIKQLRKLIQEASGKEPTFANVLAAKDALRDMVQGIFDIGGSVEELDTPYVYRINIGPDGTPNVFNNQAGLERLCKKCLADVEWRGEGLGYFDMKITDPAAEVLDDVIAENR